MKIKLLLISLFSLALLSACTTDDSIVNDELIDMNDIDPVSPKGDEYDIEL